MAPAISHHWHPIALPPDPAALEVQELRAFETMWRRERESLHEQRAVQDFNERMARWWSIETGIIERLYTLSDGITVQLVEKGFDVGLIPHGESNLSAEELVAILRDHRESLDFAMDIVGGQRPLTTGWIKELHALLTRNQEATEGFDSMGRRVEFPLLRGAWKVRPNNPLTRDGSVHEYCPPDQVASEMDRLIEFYQACPPFSEVRAAWLHHAFTQIHPFQDGNGRVARVLASIDFIKAGLFPLLVRRTERDRYIDALRVADTGDLAPLVRYFADVQQVLVRRAISEAEGAIDAKSGLSTVLAAAKKKRARRAEVAPAERKVLRERLTALLDDAQRLWEETAATIRKQLSDIDVRPVERADAGTRDHYRAQLLDIGQRHDYWVERNEHRDWVRLQLRDGGVTDVVVATHLIGNPSPGAAVAVVFIEHRDLAEPVGSPALTMVAAEPLLLSADENEEAQLHRFRAWLETARNTALAQWTKFL